MTLRKQALGSILLTTMVLVAVLYWSSRSIILKGFSELESSHVRGTMEQVLGYVSRETVSLDAAISQWTAGKDASEIVKEAEPRVSGTEVGDGVLSALRLHVLVLISPEGQVVLSRSDGLGKDQESQIVSWIKEAFPASVKLYRQPDKVGASSGSVLLPEGPMLITARPLLAKPEREPFRGVLFAGRFLDLREIESLDRGMRLTVTRIEPEDRQGSGSIDRLCDGLSKDEPVCVRVTGPDQISGYVLLSDVHGAPEMVLTMDAPREIFERGRATVNYFLLSLVGVGLIFAAVIMFVLDRQIVSRLTRLSAGVSNIGAGPDLKKRVDEAGTDELSTLGREINIMLAALRSSEDALRSARDELEDRVRERTAELVEANERLRQEIRQRMLVEDDLRKSEEQIRGSLVEKEVLLREIHHRVKNNLQVMASLLNLQSGYVKDDRVLQVFRDAESRIWSMALVHETLYQSGNLALIRVREYVQTLVEELFTSHADDRSRIGLKVQVQDHSFGLDTAIPLGLIINELVSNAFKHAFPQPDEPGEISVCLRALSDHEFELTVEDSGVGMAPDLAANSGKSFGLHLVKALVRQLDGELSVHADRGTKVVIRFRDSSTRPTR